MIGGRGGGSRRGGLRTTLCIVRHSFCLGAVLDSRLCLFFGSLASRFRGRVQLSEENSQSRLWNYRRHRKFIIEI